MKTSKPLLSYSLRLNRDGSIPDLTFSFRYVVSRENDDRPVTSFDTDYSDRATLDMKFQCNRGEIRPGTLDGPNWYGMRIEMETKRLTDDQVLRDVRRILPKDMGSYDNNVPAILAALDRAKVPHLHYSAAISRWVPVSVWALAESYQLYYEKGISTSGGCVVNAFARRGSDDAAITAAVTAALRKSSYCSDKELADWIVAGSKWERGYYDGAPRFGPPTREQILGRPAPVEVPAEPAAELQPAA